MTIITVIPQGPFELEEMFKNEKEIAAFAKNSSSGGLWWTGYADGTPACVFGVNPQSLLGETALFWVATNELVARNRYAFARGGRAIVEALLARWPRLIGHCNDPGAERFLRFLGASIGSIDPRHGMTTFRLEKSR